jgi:hypothetical protein
MITDAKVRYACKEHVDLAELDGEVVLFDAETCRVTKLNELGGLIWFGLRDNEDVEGIINRIREQYDVDRETATNDCLRFIRQLQEIGLLEILPAEA